MMPDGIPKAKNGFLDKALSAEPQSGFHLIKGEYTVNVKWDKYTQREKSGGNSLI